MFILPLNRTVLVLIQLNKHLIAYRQSSDYCRGWCLLLCPYSAFCWTPLLSCACTC